MPLTLTKVCFQRLVDDDLTWLLKQPAGLARDHIEHILRDAPNQYYPKAPHVHKWGHWFMSDCQKVLRRDCENCEASEAKMNWADEKKKKYLNGDDCPQHEWTPWSTNRQICLHCPAIQVRPASP